MLIANQQIKGQNLSSELNAIALSNDMMGGAVVVFCENQVMNSFYFGKSDLQRNMKKYEINIQNLELQVYRKQLLLLRSCN